MRNPAKCKWENKGMTSIWGKVCAYTWVSENLDHSYTKIRKYGHSYTFFKKRGFIIYLAALKKGAFLPAHLTMSYIGIYPLWRSIEYTSFPYQAHSRGITQMFSKGVEQVLNVTHPLDLIYIPTKYYQNISKGIQVIECTSFCIYPPNLISGG